MTAGTTGVRAKAEVDIESTHAGLGDKQSTVGVKSFGDAVSDLKECPECHDMVRAGLEYMLCIVVMITEGTGYSSCPHRHIELHGGSRSDLSDAPVHPEILRTLQTSMSDADIDAALEHPEMVIARGPIAMYHLSMV